MDPSYFHGRFGAEIARHLFLSKMSRHSSGGQRKQKGFWILAGSLEPYRPQFAEVKVGSELLI